MLCHLDEYRLTLAGERADSREVDQAEIGQKERRVERVRLETDRHRIIGDVTLPPEGYQSRFSDSLNRDEFEFLSLTDCDVTSLADGTTRKQPFLMLSKRHIRVGYPVEGAPDAAGPPAASASSQTR